MLQWPSSQKVKRTKNGQNRGGLDREEQIERVLERENFSLKIRVIRLSAVFGTRRRTALRGEGYACTPDFEFLTNSER